jgi:nucleolar protein 56
MTKRYLFSNVLGCHLLDEHFGLLESHEWKSPLTDLSHWQDEERSLMKKHGGHGGDTYTYIGTKDIELVGVSATHELPAVRHALKAFQDPKFHERFREMNIAITKNDIRGSVGKDLLIVQTVSSLEDLQRTTSILVNRLREWHGYIVPEFSASIQNQAKFTELVAKNGVEELLREIRVRPEDSMAPKVSDADLKEVQRYARTIGHLYEAQAEQEKYLERLMQEVCPNMTAITGALIGAKLLRIAGSLKRLSKMPSSTVQILGAEKALFRHLTTKARSPKYGILHEHPFIAQTQKKFHGKIARALADKISIAVKVDYFKGEPIGEELRRGLEKRFQR